MIDNFLFCLSLVLGLHTKRKVWSKASSKAVWSTYSEGGGGGGGERGMEKELSLLDGGWDSPLVEQVERTPEGNIRKPKKKKKKKKNNICSHVGNTMCALKRHSQTIKSTVCGCATPLKDFHQPSLKVECQPLRLSGLVSRIFLSGRGRRLNGLHTRTRF